MKKVKKCKENEHYYKEREGRGIVFVSENTAEKRLVKCSRCGDLAFGVRSNSGPELVIIKKFKKARLRPPWADYGEQWRGK